MVAADDADGHVDIGAVAKHASGWQLDGLDEREVPVGPAEHAGDDVGDVEDAGDQEDLFDALVIALHDQDPDERRCDRHTDILGDVEELHAAGDSGELGGYVAEVDDDQEKEDDEGCAEAELFADEVAEAFAGDRSHASAHLLHDDEGDGDGDHRPQQAVAVLCARGRVGEDATGVIVDVGRDETGAEDGEEDQKPGLPSTRHVS